MIRVQNVSKKFENKTVLDKISFSATEGEALALLGPNGAGKTTLINILLGLLKADSGEAEINGLNVWNNRKENSKEIGVVLERSYFYPELSAQENLLYFCRLYGVDDRKVKEVLQNVKLENSGNTRFKNFSMGMKQRLNVALALLKSPVAVIFDEPTNGLDPVGILEIRNIIKAIADRGITVILCSHLLKEVEMSCKRAIILKEGRLLADVNTDQIKKGNQTFKLMYNEPGKIKKIIPDNKNISLLDENDQGLTVMLKDGFSGSDLSKSLAEQGIFLDQMFCLDSLETKIIEILNG